MAIPEYLDDFVHLFFPAYCAGCDNVLSTGEQLLCTSCRLELPVLSVADAEREMMERLTHEVEISFAFCWLSYQKKGMVSNILHSLKYEGNAKLAYGLGRILGCRLFDLNEQGDMHFDYLVPVPISKSKLKKRGYNQANELAQGISDVSGIPIIDALKRLDNSKQFSQTTKHRQERFENVKQQFALNTQIEFEKLHGQHIIIIDDVFTTGATLEVCASLFRNVQVKSIGICTLSLTV